MNLNVPIKLKDVAYQFHTTAHEAACNIKKLIVKAGCGYRLESHHNKNGIVIEFVFRGETDYTLLIPWDYVEDNDKIQDYYERFQAYIKDTHTIPEIDRLSHNFSTLEINTINCSQSYANTPV